MNAMTNTEIEAFRALTALGEKAAAMFRIASGKTATVVAPGKVEIFLPYVGMLRHGATDVTTVGAQYLLDNLAIFAAGGRP